VRRARRLLQANKARLQELERRVREEINQALESALEEVPA